MRLLFLIVFLLGSSCIYAGEYKNYIVEFYPQPLAVVVKKDIKSKKTSDKKYEMETQHQKFLSALSAKFGKQAAQTKYQYFYAFNGMSLSLNAQQLQWVKQNPDIKSISQEVIYKLNTDIGPQWIGADNVWNGLALDTPGNKGEGVVIGVIDTGIYPQHPSFQTVSEAGTANEYSHTNPRGHTYGLCTPGVCNQKLIGIYDFTTGVDFSNGLDTVGHGSHVAGIAAGNVYSTSYQGLNFTVSGVAPRANIISYKACYYSEDAAGGLCNSGSLMEAIDQATADQVDVVNYSIGSETPCSPWGGLDNNGNFCGEFSNGQSAAAMLNAREAGVVFVVSAGNSGPGEATIGYPAVAPWVITAANSTHSRQLQSSVTAFSGGNSDLGEQDELVGASATGGIGPLRIVHAKDYGNALCGQGEPELKSQCSGAGNDVLTGISNPFPPGTFNGEIVVCDRGSYGRVEKGFNVKQSGAGGFILANTVGQQESIVADQHCLPATHLGNIAGTRLRNWLDSGNNHMASITGQTLVYDNNLGDVMNFSSSRGPTEIIYNTPNTMQEIRVKQNYMKPNVSAPGTSILSADYQSSGIVTKSGTSMSAPHISGSVALIKSAHPEFSPAQIISSLILTADNSQMRKEDGVTSADFNDQGAGRTRVDLAIANSIYFDVSRQQFIDSNPQNGVDITQLNLPEIVNDNCYPSCTFTRKVRKISSFNVVNPIWRVTTEQNNGLDITVSPDSFDFSGQSEVTLTINVNTTANDVIGGWAEAKILFELVSATNSDPLPDTLFPAVSKLPLAVYVPAGSYPEFVTQNVDKRHGEFSVSLTNISPMTEAVYQGSNIVVPETNEFNLTPTNGISAFDDSGIYVESTDSNFTLFEVAEEYTAVIIELSGGGLSDLYVGQDLNINDTPDKYEVLCEKLDFENEKSCILRHLRPGKYWILADNRISANNLVSTRMSGFTLNDIAEKADFSSVYPPVKGSGLYVNGPVVTGVSATLDVRYELPVAKSESGEYVGLISVGADSDSVGDTAIIPVKFTANNLVSEKLFSLNNEVAEFHYQPGMTFSDMYVDTGLGADTLKLQSIGRGFSVRVYQTDFNFNPLNIKPDLSALSPVITTLADETVQNPAGGEELIYYANIDISDYPPSRWYLEITPEGEAGYTALNALVNYNQEALVSPLQSLWYNPSRSGWGIDLSRTQSSQSIIWYTYGDENNKPTWYLSAASITPQNQWTAPMNRFSWDGGHARSQLMGETSIVYITQDLAVISFSLPNATYSEVIASAYPNATDCPEVNPGEIFDITGLWYQPVMTGFGNTVLATENNENAVLYFYAGDGQPTWLIGNRSFNDSTITMNQVTNGFCPGCDHTSIILNPVGTMLNQYTSDNSGSSEVDVLLIPPLSGHWQSSGTSTKLNVNFGCNINL